MKPFYTVILLGLLTIAACTPKQADPEVEGPPRPVNPPVDVKYIEVPHQSNVVTPEYWDEFGTDIKMAIFFSRIDSLELNQIGSKDIVKTYSSNNEIEYHEYYTDDTYGMVQLNDSLFFDLTHYLNEYQEGFLFLGPSKQLILSSGEFNESETIEALSFFKEEL